jgi:hypothetical protein
VPLFETLEEAVRALAVSRQQHGYRQMKEAAKRLSNCPAPYLQAAAGA